mgnify:CR=1 FL=1
MKKLYFQHDFNARNSVKLQEVLMDLGVEGIGLYWCIIEQMYEQGGSLPLRSCKSIAFALHVDGDKVAALINNYGLFECDDDNFWSLSVIKRLEENRSLSLKRRQAAMSDRRSARKESAAVNSEAIAEQKPCNCSANVDASLFFVPQEIEKETEAKKETEKERVKEKAAADAATACDSATRFAPPSLDEVKAYVEKESLKIDAERFWQFYESKGWMIGRNKMKKWKAAAAAWARSEHIGRPVATIPNPIAAATDERIKHCNDEWL